MNILKFVTKNLFRRKGRFVFTLLGISVGMAAFVALFSLGTSMRSEIGRQADALGANFIITPENICIYNQMAILTGDTITELLRQEVFERVAGIEGLTVIPHLTQRTAVNNIPAVVIGILPEETKAFRGWEMQAGEFFISQDEHAIVIGADLATRQQLQVGDEIPVRGETFLVKGILKENQSTDDSSIFIPLSIVQRLYEKEGYISYMSANVDHVTEIERYEAAILDVANVQVSTDEELLGAVMIIVNSVNVTLQLVAAVSLLAAAFGIVNTMMTAISERRREIGILRAMGGTGGTIFKIFLVESSLYGLFGGIVGVVFGLIASLFASPLIAQGSAAEILRGANPGAHLSLAVIVIALSLSLVIAVISGLYPALRAAKMTPVEAISYE